MHSERQHGRHDDDGHVSGERELHRIGDHALSAAVTGAGGLNQVLPVSYVNNVNPGTATASATYAGNGNYGSSSDSKTFTILLVYGFVNVQNLPPPSSKTFNSGSAVRCAGNTRLVVSFTTVPTRSHRSRFRGHIRAGRPYRDLSSPTGPV